MKIEIKRAHKSIPQGITFKLPSFSVLTGKNGSGKSHLLEAIKDSNISRVTDGDKVLTNIQHIGFNGLNPQVDEQCDSTQVISHARGIWQNIENWQRSLLSEKERGQSFGNIFTDFLPRFGNPHYVEITRKICSKISKEFEALSEEDILYNYDVIDINPNGLFFSQFALIFKTYHTRYIKNQFSEFRSQKYASSNSYLSNEEFVAKYGPAPWELINEILTRAGLTYQVTSPDISDFDTIYKLRLVDRISKTDISFNDLSTGEKVLMSLALAIYNTKEGSTKPDILLIDEPDAPLHPEFSKILIDTLLETILQRSGVSVVITTHSPSTVAMCPDNSIFELDRIAKTLTMISRQKGIEILTSGINHLKVAYENRRQIFVESKYDVQYYQRLFDILARKYQYNFSPIFLEPHSGTSNCTDVINIVRRLVSGGSDLVNGIIDYDTVNCEESNIIILGKSKRYAIENYILDPLYIALALIRSNRKKFSDYGISGNLRYTDASNLSVQDIQTIVNSILVTLELSSSNTSIVTLENSFQIYYPNEFLLMNGHAYEHQLSTKCPELMEISRGKGDSALKLGIMNVIDEYPQFLPKELADTFYEIR